MWRESPVLGSLSIHFTLCSPSCSLTPLLQPLLRYLTTLLVNSSGPSGNSSILLANDENFAGNHVICHMDFFLCGDWGLSDSACSGHRHYLSIPSWGCRDIFSDQQNGTSTGNASTCVFRLIENSSENRNAIETTTLTLTAAVYASFCSTLSSCLNSSATATTKMNEIDACVDLWRSSSRVSSNPEIGAGCDFYKEGTPVSPVEKDVFFPGVRAPFSCTGTSRVCTETGPFFRMGRALFCRTGILPSFCTVGTPFADPEIDPFSATHVFCQRSGCYL
mmetsp:Transcript_14841/g.60299  ORF Transcript_14841/g.60299 Transcript_14841/m.60299 type:complete len:277 (+) Transcript_14841:4227-5057(+)